MAKRTVNRRQFSIGVAAAATVGAIGFQTASAQDASPAAEEGMGLPPLPEGGEVVAEGFFNATGLAIDEAGTLYVAEQGFIATPEEPPAPPADPSVLQEGSPLEVIIPGQIHAIAADGTASVLASGIPQATSIALSGGKLYAVAGGMSISAGFLPIDGENRITAVDTASGEISTVAELGMFEFENNPDGTDINPNLYGIAADADGQLYVADAGGNTLFTVDPATGEFALFAVVPTQEELMGGSPVAPEMARQPVPTSIAIDGDGVIHVTLLSEAWSGPSILAYTPDGEYTTGAGPLSAVVGSAIGPDGNLYIVQLSDNMMQEQPALGSVHRVNADGTTEAVIEGLFFPHGIAIDAEGTVYLTVNSIISGPDAPMGQVVKFAGIAAAM